MIPRQKEAKARWRLNLRSRLTNKPTQDVFQCLVLDQSLIKITDIVEKLIGAGQDSIDRQIADTAKQLTYDMYLVRACRQQNISIFREHVRRMTRELIKKLKKYKVTEHQNAIKILNFTLDCKITLLNAQIYQFLGGIFTYLSNNKSTSDMSGTLFVAINSIAYHLIKLCNAIDITKVDSHEVYREVDGIDRVQASFTLLELIKKNNTDFIKSLGWLNHLSSSILESVIEAIKQLTSEGVYYNPLCIDYVGRLVPKAVELSDNLGFVCQSKLFKEAYWLYNIEGIFKLMVAGGVATVEDAQKMLAILIEFDYCPSSALKLLADFMLLPEYFEETEDSELDEIMEHLELMMETGGIPAIILHNMFQKFNFKSQGFVSILLEMVRQLKWDALIPLRSMVQREDREKCQLFIMRSGIVDFLIQSLLRGNISTPYLKQTFNFLSQLMIDNIIGLEYFMWTRLKLQQQEQTLVDIISRRMCDSSQLVMTILVNYEHSCILVKNAKNTKMKIQQQFLDRLSQWFMAASLARQNTNDSATVTNLTLLRILLLSLDDDTKQQLLQNYVICCKFSNATEEEIERGEATIDDNPVMIQQTIEDCQAWLASHKDEQRTQLLTGLTMNKIVKYARKLINKLKQF